MNPLVPFQRVIVKGRLGGSELSLPVSKICVEGMPSIIVKGPVLEGISLTT